MPIQLLLLTGMGRDANRSAGDAGEPCGRRKGDPGGVTSIASTYLNARLPEQIGLFT